MKSMRNAYVSPRVFLTVEILLEKDMLFGSIVDDFFPIESFGQEQGGFYQYESTLGSESTFNHTWGE